MGRLPKLIVDWRSHHGMRTQLHSSSPSNDLTIQLSDELSSGSSQRRDVRSWMEARPEASTLQPGKADADAL